MSRKEQRALCDRLEAYCIERLAKRGIAWADAVGEAKVLVAEARRCEARDREEAKVVRAMLEFLDRYPDNRIEDVMTMAGLDDFKGDLQFVTNSPFNKTSSTATRAKETRSVVADVVAAFESGIERGEVFGGRRLSDGEIACIALLMGHNTTLSPRDQRTPAKIVEQTAAHVATASRQFGKRRSLRLTSRIAKLKGGGSVLEFLPLREKRRQS